MSVESRKVSYRTYAVRLVPILFQEIQPFRIDLQRRNPILAQRLDVIQGLGEPRASDQRNTSYPLRLIHILGRFKDIIKLLLQRRRFREGPVRLLLMAKDDIVENRSGDTHETGNFFVHFRTLGRDCVSLIPHPELDGRAMASCKTTHLFPRINPINLAQDSFQRLHRQSARLLHRDLQISSGDHSFALHVPESESDLGLDLLFSCHLRIAIVSASLIKNVQSELTLGSCTKAPPLVFGGSSPVVAYFKHSMMVFKTTDQQSRPTPIHFTRIDSQSFPFR
jgi:hypothetical protein